MVVITALSVFIVLVIILISISDSINLYSFALYVGGYTLISIVCSIIVVYLFPKIFKRLFNKKNWTRGRYLVCAFITILLISVSNTLYDHFIMNIHFFAMEDEISFYENLYANFKITVLIGIIPITIGYFWLKNRELFTDLHEKEEQNRVLTFRIHEKEIHDEQILTLSGNSKESLTLFPHELLYMESVGNYVRIHFQIDGKISQKTLRATLLQMEEFLSDYPYMVRCHRAFIVNTHQIEKMSGFKIWLKTLETEIPISRTYKANIKSPYFGYSSQM